MRAIYSTLILACCLLIFTACGGTGDSGKSAEGVKADKSVVKETAPVTLTLGIQSNQFTDDEFQKYFVIPVSKKYPNITLNRINTTQKGNLLADLAASGQIPDIVLSFPSNLPLLSDLGMDYNMDDLIKSHNFDMNRIDPAISSVAKSVMGLDYTVGLPSYNNTFGTFYNKNLFDRFAVPYPKDNMTWDDMTELAKKMTRTDGGVQYRGAYAEQVVRGSWQLGLPSIDFTTNKSLLRSEDWKNLLAQYVNFYNIPGNMDGEYRNLDNGVELKSFEQGQLAMLVGNSNTTTSLLKADFDWDVVTFPTNKKRPKVGLRADSPFMSVTKQSKNKDAAFNVIATILTNDVQTDLTRNGRATVLKDVQLKEQFGKNMNGLESKNLAAMTKLEIAGYVSTKFVPEKTVVTEVNNAFMDVISQKKDLNTALRDADEKLNQEIAALLNQ
jgi:multiple sugar transport system substrate-binding protein